MLLELNATDAVQHWPGRQLISFYKILEYPLKNIKAYCLTLLSPISQEHSAAAFNASTCSQSSDTSHIQPSDKSLADE